MGSDSDLPSLQPAIQILEDFEWLVEVKVNLNRYPLSQLLSCLVQHLLKSRFRRQGSLIIMTRIINSALALRTIH